MRKRRRRSRMDSRARAPRDAISDCVMSLGSATYVSRAWCKQESTGLHLFNSSQVYFYMKLGLCHHSYTNVLHYCTDFPIKTFRGYCDALGDTLLIQITPARLQCNFRRVSGNNRERTVHAFSILFVTVKNHKRFTGVWVLALPSKQFCVCIELDLTGGKAKEYFPRLCKLWIAPPPEERGHEFRTCVFLDCCVTLGKAFHFTQLYFDCC